jgi:hypothetical protein
MPGLTPKHAFRIKTICVLRGPLRTSRLAFSLLPGNGRGSCGIAA